MLFKLDWMDETAGDQGDDGWGCRLQLRVYRDQRCAARGLRIHAWCKLCLFALSIFYLKKSSLWKSCNPICMQGWGMTVVLGIHATPKMMPLHPMELFDGRRITGCVFGDFKGKSQLPDLVDKFMNGVHRTHYIFCCKIAFLLSSFYHLFFSFFCLSSLRGTMIFFHLWGKDHFWWIKEVEKQAWLNDNLMSCYFDRGWT